MSEDGETNRGSKTKPKSREQILEAAETESSHKGNSTSLLTVNNELTRNQIHQQQRLEEEIESLRGSIDSYKRWSKGLTLALIFLSVVVVLLTLALLLAELGVIS